MRLTVETIIIVLLAVAVAGILLLIFTGQTDTFDDFLGERSDEARCDYYQENPEEKPDDLECQDSGSGSPNTNPGEGG